MFIARFRRFVEMLCNLREFNKTAKMQNKSFQAFKLKVKNKKKSDWRTQHLNEGQDDSNYNKVHQSFQTSSVTSDASIAKKPRELHKSRVNKVFILIFNSARDVKNVIISASLLFAWLKMHDDGLWVLMNIQRSSRFQHETFCEDGNKKKKHLESKTPGENSRDWSCAMTFTE